MIDRASAARTRRRAAPKVQRKDGRAGRGKSLFGRAASLVGRLNLAELGEVLGRACLFIGPDSGPMHIAAASGVPIVALFGPTLPAHFAPWRSRAAILEKRLE